MGGEYKGVEVDGLTDDADEGRSSLRKVLGRWQATVDPRMSEWGNPVRGMPDDCHTEYIGMQREPREVKHLST